MVTTEAEVETIGQEAEAEVETIGTQAEVKVATTGTEAEVEMANNNNGKPIKPTEGDYSDYNAIFVNSDGDKGSVSDKKPFTGIGTGTRPGEAGKPNVFKFPKQAEKKIIKLIRIDSLFTIAK